MYMKITLHTNYINTDEHFLFEFPDNWDELSVSDQYQFEDQCWEEAVSQFVDGSVEIHEGDMEEDEDY